MKKFAIYGTCVSRDVFNFLDNEIYMPKLTIEQNPTLSLFGQPLAINQEDSKIDTTNFNNRMIYYNLSKQAFTKIMDADAEYLVLDMGAERFPIQTWEYNGVKVNVPVYWDIYRAGKKLKQEHKYQDLNIYNWHLPNTNYDEWNRSLEQFCSEIIHKFEDSKIILISVRQVDKVLDKENLCTKSLTINRNEFNAGIEKRAIRDKQNELIKYAEDYIKKKIPECWVIEMPNRVIGNVAHHFSEHPLHYIYPYYEYVAQAIQLIVKERENSKENRDLVQKQLNFLLTRYNEKFARICQFLDKTDKHKVQFWGSLELFDALDNDNSIDYSNPLLDISVGAILSEPKSLSRKDCKDHLEEKEMVALLNDVTKTNKLALQYSTAKWLVVDLRGECKSVISVNADEKSVIMNQYTECAVKLLRTLKIIDGGGYIKDEFKWNEKKENEIREFGRLLVQVWKQENIIVVENYFTEYYLDEKLQIKKRQEAILKNEYLKKCYYTLYEILPNCKIIKKPQYAVSFVGNQLDYLSIEEKSYYKNSIRAILEDKAAQAECYYDESTIKNKLLLRKVKGKKLLIG